MIQSHEMHTYTSNSSILKIVVGDFTQVDVLGWDTMQFTNGCINVVLLVLEIFANLLIIYGIFHFGDGHT